ncbi:MAG TPA: glutathione S-transferase N-terminal domain-containing protein [Nevskia sp.]|jgi:glutathione S-transferase|nr:glutathione S-transferase N-terminal domain-containing protein [Nevskia sp.]
MKMKLYLSLTSPYARKVRMVVRELGLVDLVQEAVVDPWNAGADFLAANPLSKVPTLVTDKGEALPDSKLIVEYLLTRGRGLATLPRGAQRWALLRRQQLAEGIIDAAVAMRLEQAMRPPEFAYQGWLDRQVGSINRALDALDLDAGELLHEGPVRMVEIAVGAALGYLDFRQPQLQWRHGRERLASWYFSFAQRPSMQATQPPAA